MRSMKLALAGATFAIAFSGVALAADDSATEHGLNTAAIDKSVVPGDDFYNYANGAWLKTAVIPGDLPVAGPGVVLFEKANKRTSDLIAEMAKSNPAPGTDEQKVGDYYSSFMDEAGIEAKGLAPLKADLDRIQKISSKKDLATVMGASMRADVDPLNNTNFFTENLFGIWVAPGYSDSAHYTPYLLASGLGLPNREFYLADNAKMAALRDAYKAHIAAILELAKMPNAKADADAVMALETSIAKADWAISDSQDIAKTNNPWAADDFAKQAPGLDWKAYFAGAGLAKQKQFIVWQPSAFTGIAKIVADAPLNVWKSYLAFHLLNHFSPLLPKAFVDENFAFYGKTLSGTPQIRDRWKRAVAATNFALGDAIGKVYAARYFSPEDKAVAQAMVKNIVEAYGHRIDKLDWMTPGTKAKAKEKLFSLYIGLGYPEHWIDYSKLNVVKGDAFGNFKRSETFFYHRSIDRLGGPVDRTEWSMTPQTVNAVNLPLQNALNFPAAFMDRPYFDAKADPALNYGAIGAIIGHEISHSFDNQGALFDASGRLANWWTKDDFAHFEASGKTLIAQYNTYHPFPDLAVNGQQTLGENIADVAGLSASYDGWRASLGGKPPEKSQGYTEDQLFFLAFSQSWGQKIRDQALRQQVLVDVHSPDQYRGISLRNLDAWYDAFNVKPGQKLYLAPAERVRVW